MTVSKEESQISIHYASQTTDKQGSGKSLLQYSYLELKEDMLRWLDENGQIPSTTTQAYFDEVKMFKKTEKENMELKEQIKSLGIEFTPQKIPEKIPEEETSTAGYKPMVLKLKKPRNQESSSGEENKSEVDEPEENELAKVK